MASAAMHKIIYAYTSEENYGQAIVLADEFLDRYPGRQPGAARAGAAGLQPLPAGGVPARPSWPSRTWWTSTSTPTWPSARCSCRPWPTTGPDQLDRLITNYNYIASKLLPTPSHWRARTYYYLGEAYYDQGLYREAEGMYRLVLTGYPRSNVAAASLQGLVASLSRNGEYELALEEQEKFLLALANADSEKGTNSLAVGIDLLQPAQVRGRPQAVQRLPGQATRTIRRRPRPWPTRATATTACSTTSRRSRAGRSC